MEDENTMVFYVN